MSTPQPPKLLPLPGLGLIHAHGADAAAFLDAQLTRRVGDLDTGHSRLAAWCDAKGRARALLRGWRHDDGFLLQLPAELVDSVCRGLRMYVLRARVLVDDAGACLRQYGLCGGGAPSLLAHYMEGPTRSDGVYRQQTRTLLSLPGRPQRYCLIGEDKDLADLRSQLPTADASEADRIWRLAAIRAGLPQLYAATQGLFVPQMLNLHWLDGIDFQKGCYPGQEVVARLQYRGRLARRLVRAACAAPVAPGDAVVGTDGAREGTVVDAAADAAGGYELLAVLRVAVIASKLMINGQALTLLDLPYGTD